ncbi:MAG: hypothetical protein NTW87_32090, partial [Planctomycetota bacterium]|nr:hypothetical protein [Planctomycetota bacterium]
MSLPFSRQSRSGLTATPVRRPRAGTFPEEHVGPLGIVFCLLLLAATVLILDYGVLPPPYAERARPLHDIYARLDYRYSDPDELNRQRDAAAERAPRVYVEDAAWADRVLQDLLELIGIVEKAKSAEEARERAARYPHDLDLAEALYKYNLKMGPERTPLRTMLADRIRRSLQIIADNGVLTPEDYDAERYRREIVRVVPGATGESSGTRVPVERLRSADMIANDELRRASWRENLPEALDNQLYRHLRSRLEQNPCNLVLDPALTARQQELARERVGLSGDVSVKRHSLILSKDRPASKSDLERLHAEYRAYKRSLPWESRARELLALTSVALAVLLIFLFAAARGQAGVLRRRRALAMLGLLTIAVLAVGRGLLLAGESAALTPVVFVAMVASLAFGQTIALLTLFALCILSTMAGVHWEAAETAGVFPALSLALMAGGIAAALPPERLQGRWDLLRYGALGGVVQGALAVGMSLLGGGLLLVDAPANVAAEHAAAL